MDDLVKAALAIVGGTISLAVISVLVSKNAQTPAVFTAAGGSLATVINAAVSPITGVTSGGGATSSNPFSLPNLSSLANIASIFG